jgi:aerobic carbon-monoxide dehydrogenase small subunit
VTVELNVNREQRTTNVDPMTSLADVLRDELHLTGTKTACGEGFCGSCMVLVDDEPMMSCLLPAGMLAGREVRTIESISVPGGELSPVQQALKDNDAVQCGMCFPGMVMSLTALIEHEPHPTDDDVRTALVGNLCRCTGYERIVEAALATSRSNGSQEASVQS